MPCQLAKFLISLRNAVFAGCLVATLFSSLAAHAKVDVLASIKPLALIAEAVVQDKAQVNTLLPVQASPHDYALRASDMQRIHDADLVLWIGPELESFLRRPLANLAPEQRMMVYQLPGLFWPEKGAGEEEQNEGRGESVHRHMHDHTHTRDPHLWLDPRNAVVIARALAVRLGEIDTSSAARYHANAEAFAAQQESLDQRLQASLKPFAYTGFAVYHEGYSHFAGRYGLHQVAYVTLSPERRPGARHLYHLRQQLANNASCLFIESYYDTRIGADLARELDLRLATLDPIGNESVTSYTQLLEQLAKGFKDCLEH